MNYKFFDKRVTTSRRIERSRTDGEDDGESSKALITVRQIFCLSPSRHTNRASRDQISYRKFRDDDLVSARLLSLRSKSRFERMFLILPRTDRFKLSSVASSFIFFFSCLFANQSIVRIEISKIIIFCLEMIYRYNLSFVSILQTGSRWLVEVLA